MITLFFFIFCLCLFIVVVFLRFFYKLWLNPIRMQNMLHSQGLRGPSYKLIHGNTKETFNMRTEAMRTHWDLWQHDIFPRILPHLNTWMKLYGNNFLVWNGHQPQIIVTDPELAKEILSNKEGVFWKIELSGDAKKFIGGGLAFTEGEKWSRLRKLADHAFHGESLKDMVPAMVASVEAMLEKWGYHPQGEEIEISKEFKLLTSEVISRTAFGSSYLEGKNIFEMLTKLGVLIARNTFKITFVGLTKIWRSTDEIESDKIEQSLRQSILALIKKREDKVKTGEADNFGSDYLGSLLKVHHDMDEQSRISVDDIIDECKVFYVAGHETTSSLLSWAVVLLSIYKDWQEKAREEVLQLLGHEKPTAEGIARLKILTMIINETLRLYSPVVLIQRRVHKKTKLGKYQVPANVHVSIPSLALHRDPEIWGKDAHLFNPERFAEGLGKATNGNTMAFLPFGSGPRQCVGLNFAVNEAKVALSMILQRYRLTVSPNYVHSPIQFLVVNPQHGVQIVLHLL